MHKGGVAATKSSSRRRGCLGWAGEIPGQNTCFCRFAELPVHVGPQKRRAYYSLDEARPQSLSLERGVAPVVANSTSDGLDFLVTDGPGPRAIALGESGFQLGYAGLQRRDIVCDLGHSEARGDVLRAVPVVGNDLDEEQSLHFASERLGGELIDQFGMVARVEHSSVAEQLEPGAVRVVHHKQSNPIGAVDIARANELAVALEIGEADEIRPQHLHEPGWAAAVLHVGPAGLTYGGHVETVARSNEVSFAIGERVGFGCILDDLVFAEVSVLGPLHSGR